MYEFLSSFAQTWGLLLFIAGFGAIVTYALWPRNQAKFDRFARLPLEEAGPLPDDARAQTKDADHG